MFVIKRAHGSDCGKAVREGPIAGYPGAKGLWGGGGEAKRARRGGCMRVRAGRYPEKDKCAERAGWCRVGIREHFISRFPGPASSDQCALWPAEGVGDLSALFAGLSLPPPRRKANVAAMVGWRVPPAVPPSPSRLSCPAV